MKKRYLLFLIVGISVALFAFNYGKKAITSDTDNDIQVENNKPDDDEKKNEEKEKNEAKKS